MATMVFDPRFKRFLDGEQRGGIRYHTLNVSGNCYIQLKYYRNGKRLSSEARKWGVKLKKGDSSKKFNFELYWYANRRWDSKKGEFSPTIAEKGACRYYLCNWMKHNFLRGGRYSKMLNKNVYVRGGFIEDYWKKLRTEGSKYTYSRSALSGVYERTGFTELGHDSSRGDTMLIAKPTDIMARCR